MRIIGGHFKGKKLFEAFDKNTRPLKDLVKESIFNILEYSQEEKINLKDASVLDLFSGTGSFGLECISRGASKVYFFENYNNSIEIIKKNSKKLKSEKKVKIFNMSAFNLMKVLISQGISLDSINNDGETALMIAVKRENLELVKILLNLGASPEIITPDGENALSLAETSGNIEVLNLLR